MQTPVEEDYEKAVVKRNLPLKTQDGQRNLQQLPLSIALGVTNLKSMIIQVIIIQLIKESFPTFQSTRHCQPHSLLSLSTQFPDDQYAFMP